MNVLLRAGLLPRTPTSPVSGCLLQVWSDCSGINSEKFALEAINTAFAELLGTQVSWNLYCCCDVDQECLRFTRKMHRPTHTSCDIRHRNFQHGNFFCQDCQENVPLPTSGIDMYIGTYPCSPWSRRGKRTGFDHPDAEPLFIGLETITYLKPPIWLLELGELHDQAARAGVQEVIAKAMRQSGSQLYTMHMMSDLSPLFSGYPIQRPRFFIMGWRLDLGSPEAVTAPLQALLAEPMQIEHSFHGFLGLCRKVDWSRVGEYPQDEELLWCTDNPCKCSCNPRDVCPVHKCKCSHCGADGLACSWRALLGEFIAKVWTAAPPDMHPAKLTYVQVLEMNGAKAPDAPRLRTYLNIMALHPHARPLNSTLMIVDVSQNPPYQGMCRNGVVPTLATSSAPFCFQTGEFLTTYQIAALMGIQLEKIELMDFKETWLRKKVGLCVHTASFGVALMALAAVPLGQLWQS